MFVCVQGPVSFDENGDRRGLTQIEQLQVDDEVQVGVYNPFSPCANKIQWDEHRTVYWKGYHILNFPLSLGVAILTENYFVLSQATRLTDGQTDGQTDRCREQECALTELDAHKKVMMRTQDSSLGPFTPFTEVIIKAERR